MTDLNFSIMLLIEQSQNSGERFITPTKDMFNTLDDSFTYNKDGSLYEVCVEKQNEYVFFVFSFGNPEPRDENLTDINTGDKTPNPRTTEQAELNNQAFFLFHYGKKRLYVSDSRKKGLFGAILKEKMHTDFVVKDIFKNEDEFIETLKECSSISFTHINDLFSSDSKQKQALVDLTGTDAPERFEISAKYTKNNLFVEFIKKLAQGKRENKISSLSICGIDESGFQLVYNVDSFQQKFKISCQKDENGKFIINDVRDSLLKKIE